MSHTERHSKRDPEYGVSECILFVHFARHGPADAMRNEFWHIIYSFAEV